MTSNKISFLLNWEATPYHAPLFLAKSLGYFKEQGIEVAIVEPNDPSDVTELIGRGSIDMGFKAMVHTIAGRARGFPVTSIGSLMDEPFTGVVYLEGGGITTDFESLRGKRIGYVGEFGKIQIDELTKHYGMLPSDYEAVRVGMNVAGAIIDGSIHAGIGLENVQMVQLEEWCKSQGKDPKIVKMLRIDELAKLVANDKFLAENEPAVSKFMKAIKKATDFLIADPAGAWKEYCSFKKGMDTPLNAKIYERSFVYMSRDLKNVDRDWQKVTNYCKRLGVLEGDFTPNYTNKYISWDLEADLVDPDYNQFLVAQEQEKVKAGTGGVLTTPRLVEATA